MSKRQLDEFLREGAPPNKKRKKQQGLKAPLSSTEEKRTRHLDPLREEKTVEEARPQALNEFLAILDSEEHEPRNNLLKEISVSLKGRATMLLEYGILKELEKRMDQEDLNRTYEDDESSNTKDPKIATVLKLYVLLMPAEKDRSSANIVTCGLLSVLRLISKHQDGYVLLLALNALVQLMGVNDENVRTVAKSKSYEDVLNLMGSTIYASSAAAVIQALLDDDQCRGVVIRSRDVNSCLFNLLKSDDANLQLVALDVLSHIAKYEQGCQALSKRSKMSILIHALDSDNFHIRKQSTHLLLLMAHRYDDQKLKCAIIKSKSKRHKKSKHKHKDALGYLLESLQRPEREIHLMTLALICAVITVQNRKRILRSDLPRLLSNYLCLPEDPNQTEYVRTVKCLSMHILRDLSKFPDHHWNRYIGNTDLISIAVNCLQSTEKSEDYGDDFRAIIFSFLGNACRSGDGILDVIVALLNSNIEYLQAASVQTLNTIAVENSDISFLTEKGLSSLLALLRSENSEIRDNSASALGSISSHRRICKLLTDGGALELLAQLLNSDSHKILRPKLMRIVSNISSTPEAVSEAIKKGLLDSAVRWISDKDSIYELQREIPLFVGNAFFSHPDTMQELYHAKDLHESLLRLFHTTNKINSPEKDEYLFYLVFCMANGAAVDPRCIASIVESGILVQLAEILNSPNFCPQVAKQVCRVFLSVFSQEKNYSCLKSCKDIGQNLWKISSAEEYCLKLRKLASSVLYLVETQKKIPVEKFFAEKFGVSGGHLLAVVAEGLVSDDTGGESPGTVDEDRSYGSNESVAKARCLGISHLLDVPVEELSNDAVKVFVDKILIK